MTARRTDERGFVATELALGIAVLVLPVAAIVLTIPTWSERQTTARVIAREVARAVARSGECDTRFAADAAAAMGASLGLDPPARISLDCRSRSELPPRSDLLVRVTVTMPAVHLPALGSFGAWTWTARHQQPVDRYGSAR